MATSTGLKITFKAAAVESAGDEPAAKKPRPSAGGGAPWHAPSWADQFKALAPPPPRPERSALVELRTGQERMNDLGLWCAASTASRGWRMTASGTSRSSERSV